MSERQPVGTPVEPARAGESPARATYGGRFVTLAPPDPRADAAELYACSHGDQATERLWTYMPYGPFADVAAMQAWLERCAASRDPLWLIVVERARGRRAGMVSFLNVEPGHRRLELGHIWYAPAAQRTPANTECVYLMLCEAFERLRMRRVEWKCDALNERSRAAALRLGFSFEGLFRQHMIVKARNRDTAWYALLDGEWPMVKRNMERWLYEGRGEGDGRPSLRALNAPCLRPPWPHGEGTPEKP